MRSLESAPEGRYYSGIGDAGLEPGERPTGSRGRLRLRVSSRKIGRDGARLWQAASKLAFLKAGRCIGPWIWENRLGKRFISGQRGIPMQTECIAGLSAFAPVEGRKVVAVFDGGRMTSEAGRCC